MACRTKNGKLQLFPLLTSGNRKIYNFFILLLISISGNSAQTTESAEDQCKENGNNAAPACNQYYQCTFVMWYWDSQLQNCPENQYFDINLKDCSLASLVDCQSRITLPGTAKSTTSTSTSKSTSTSTSKSTSTSTSKSKPTSKFTTTSPALLSTGIPTCTTAGLLPAALCYQYYDCVNEGWSWVAQLQNCPQGYAFDIHVSQCATASSVDCQSRPTTTVTVSPSKTTTSTTKTTTSTTTPTPSLCTGPGNHPALTCYQYYECVQVGSSWTPRIQTCSEGSAFDVVSNDCRAIALVDCQNRLTTTKSATTLTTKIPPVISETCTGPGRLSAPSCYQYYECVKGLFKWKAQLQTCNDGFAFDTKRGACYEIVAVDCRSRLTTVAPSSTVSPPAIKPSCSGPARYPAFSCYEYYECEKKWWKWEATLKTCAVSEAYDVILIRCAPARLVDCRSRWTTTVSTTSTTLAPSQPLPPIVEPVCRGPGKYSAYSCYQYYECEKSWWTWKPKLKACLVGQAFDVILIRCRPVHLVDCRARWTTTVSRPTSPQPPLPPIVYPVCKGPGKHASHICYQYYECEKVGWKWKPILKACRIGQAFDVIFIRCAPTAVVDCRSRLTTTVSTPKPPTHAPPPPPIVVKPVCKGPGRHPSHSCYEYYECEKIWWWWKPELKVCPVGLTYDATLFTCRPEPLVDCRSRWTTTMSRPTQTPRPPPPIVQPVCKGPGRHPTHNCYEYFECEQVSWWWKPTLKVCERGHAFDIVLTRCAPLRLVDCEPRWTSTPAPRPPPPPIVEPVCKGLGRHPTHNCYQYFECEKESGQWKPKLKICATGHAFDVVLSKCAPARLVDCQSRWTVPGPTTPRPRPPMPPPPIAEPVCKGSGRYPAHTCYHYYECEKVWWSWKPQLKVCAFGQAYDIFLTRCRPADLVDCRSRWATTISKPTSPPPPRPPPPIAEPVCKSAGKYPTNNCYQYFECEKEGWRWKPKLKSCATGHAFDMVQSRCAPARLVDCQSRWTSTIPGPISPGPRPPPPPPPIAEPVCKGSGRYPAHTCYHYYECEKVWWSWKPQLKICAFGQAYDIFLTRCRPANLVDCRSRWATTISKPTSPPPPRPPPPIAEPVCKGAGKYPTNNCYQYFECEKEGWRWKPKLKICARGHAFDVVLSRCATVEFVDCRPRWTTTVPGPTKPAPRPPLPPPPIVEPVCKGRGRHPAHTCYHYYECEGVWWWWKPKLKVCAIGQAYDVFSKKCRPTALVECGSRWATTISRPTSTTPRPRPPPPIVEPVCNGPGKYPAHTCYHYFECERNWLQWKPKLKICVAGQAYDTVLNRCRPAALVDCHSRWATTVSKPTSTATPAPRSPPPIVEPVCKGPGKHPAQSCYHYYECEQVWWHWKPKLEVCRVGEAYDVILTRCRSASLVDCRSRWATTVSKPTSTTPAAPPRPPPPEVKPVCKGSDKYPAYSCYQYYECEKDGWKWKPTLKECAKGDAFDTVYNRCAPVRNVDCRSRWTTTSRPKPTQPSPPNVTPVCKGPDQHPASNCHQYYQCEQDGWRWEPKLTSCSRGYSFDITRHKCQPSASVDCYNRETSPPAIITAPRCYDSGKYPASNCLQYYECVQARWEWEPVLKTCPKTQAFDIYHRACFPIAQVHCQTRPIKEPPQPPNKKPQCYEEGKHPAPACYQYYECVLEWRQWEPELRTCPSGLAFDVLSKTCYPKKFVDCQHRYTKPPSTAIAPPEVPKCSERGKHPAPLCYQYYECVNHLWRLKAELKTCPEGQGYNYRKNKCVCAEDIGCRLPVEEPKCHESGKHPASKCNQYYECVRYLWWWRPELKTCPRGQGFATSLKRCARRGSSCAHSWEDSSDDSDSHENSHENHSHETSDEDHSHEDSHEKHSHEKSSE